MCIRDRSNASEAAVTISGSVSKLAPSTCNDTLQLQGLTPNYVKVVAQIKEQESAVANLWVNRITPVELSHIEQRAGLGANVVTDYHLAADLVTDQQMMRK